MASEEVIGKLSVRVVRGHNLVIADPLTHTSDPYVVLSYGSQVHPFVPPLPSISFFFLRNTPVDPPQSLTPVLTEEPSVAAPGLQWVR